MRPHILATLGVLPVLEPGWAQLAAIAVPVAVAALERILKIKGRKRTAKARAASRRAKPAPAA